MAQDARLTDMIGVTMRAVTRTREEMRFVAEDGRTWRLYNEQDCYGNVEIADVSGELDFLVGAPLLMADVSESTTRPADVPQSEFEAESQTWTFYKFGTLKGYVDVRWCGDSNGFYSESVDFELMR